MSATKVTIDTKIADRLVREFKDASRTTYRIHDGVSYGVHQEFGTEHMSGRPALVPAFTRLTKNLPDLLRAGLNGGVKPDVILRKLAWDIAGLWANGVRVRTGAFKASITVTEVRS